MNRLMRFPTARPKPRAVPEQTAAANGEARIALDPPPLQTVTVQCDQAIFTSVRSAIGEGYRVVAHSSGLSHDEKAELTRRSPSHGSLARAVHDAFGMLAFRMASGRVAVGHCVHAGKEHTARGGDRVWTHYAILDDEQYAAFGNNPIRVQRALASLVEPGAQLSNQLEALRLPTWANGDLGQPINDETACDAFVRTLDAFAQDRRWALAGVAFAPRTLEWALDMLPRGARSEISLSYGLGFCLGRALRVTIVDSVRADVERMIRGHDVKLRDANDTNCTLMPALQPWYDFIRVWTASNRWSRIRSFATRIPGTLDGETLARVAKLSLDLDEVATMDEDLKATLHHRYQAYTPQNDVESELLDQILEATAPPPDPEEGAEGNPDVYAV